MARSHDGSIITYLGTRFWPFDPVVQRIELIDIAHALANLCRFTGHTRLFYSVAEHSVRVYELVKEWTNDDNARRWALFHDAPEAYINDIAAPLKHTEAYSAYREAENRLMAAVTKRFKMSPVEPPEIKRADLILRSTEKRDLMHGLGTGDPEPLLRHIAPWSPQRARARFLMAAKELGIEPTEVFG